MRAPVRVSLVAPLLCVACTFSSARVEPLTTLPVRAPVRIPTPVKAHLLDGGTVVFVEGVVIRADTMHGAGMRYSLTLRDSARVPWVLLSEVAAAEVFRTDIHTTATVVGSTVGVAAVGLGTVVLLKALFGSCPTIYAESGDSFALEAEGFSYAIAPRFEARDVDRLAAQPDGAGRLALEVRNEALETHYLNQVELLEVRHASRAFVVPDARGVPLAAADLVTPRVTDRGGTDHTARLAHADGAVYHTPDSTLAAAAAGPFDDHLDLDLPRPAGDSAAVVLRLRNSLLNTVLLYEMLLAERGAGALTWVGRDLEDPGTALQLGVWYVSRMGMRVSVRDGATWRLVGRIPDAGPIAWKDVALMVPVPRESDRLQIRLSFAADNWRVDRVAVATDAQRPDARRLAPADARPADGASGAAVRADLAAVDGRYVVTTPGARMRLVWETGPAPADRARTFLLVTHGYYIEWMRQDWLRREPVTASGPVGDATLRRAMAAWRDRQATYEREFHASRIPVR